MPELFDRLRWPVGLSSTEILWVWPGVRIEREKVETPLSASKRGQAGPLGLVSVISPWLYLTRGSLGPFMGRPRTSVVYRSCRLRQLPLRDATRNVAMQQLHKFNI